jgi:Z1 domain
MPLNLSGSFYPPFTSEAERFSAADKACIKSTVERLLSIQTSAARPGMLLGKIQSGKTKTFLGVIALAFDNGFDCAIILTKGTKALARQTLARVRREFASFHRQDRLQMFDIMTLPAGLTPYELNQKLILVAKKQSDNMDRLTALFQTSYPQLAAKRVLIIDDEADYASVGFRNTKKQGLVINTTTQQIDILRQTLNASAFLQVTATPYALYLQPEDLVINGVEFRPIRPAFTELVPVNPNYVGSDYYFDYSQEANTIASFIYQQVSAKELEVLHHQDRRRFAIDDCLTSDAIPKLRAAICNFIVGGCIRRLQDHHAKAPLKNFSFLVHTEAQKAAHAWQERIVIAINEKLTDSVKKDPKLLRLLLTEAYDDLSASIKAMNHSLPSSEEVIQAALTALGQGWLMITKVNSERQVEELLDEDGQLRLRTPLNIFIGGQILDRGITISNLIGFFYGRRPHVFQQDTVLQHSRMFGFRPIEDLAVTRFYTAPQIYSAMRRMHESDVALRDNIERQPEQPVIFIQRDDQGHVIPCSPNKILASNTTTLRAFKRMLPIGFQSDYATRVRPVIEGIDAILDKLLPAKGPDDPVKISLTQALDLLDRIEPTILMEKDEGYDFDWDAARAALTYMSNASTRPSDRGHVWCLVRRNRNLSRRVSAGSHAVYADAPDTTRTEGTIARRIAIDVPMLMLFRQNGKEDDGWRGTPFYWPVIVAPEKIRTSIFAHETTP